ncbi:MAG: hypothetical protein P0Y66_22620 [Candidatus Kaistia colombiensis]|nr:MAG: hypothetical protein P0Y66_22620 [Kaistia sp.]
MVNPTSSSNQPGAQPGGDTPLDPAVERVRQKLRRLILVSSLTVLLGFVAVLFAVIYRIGPGGSKSGLTPSSAELRIEQAIPAGGRVVSSSLNGDQLALTLDVGGATRVVILNINTGKVLRNISLGTAAP